MACVSTTLANAVDVSEDGEERDLIKLANMPYDMTSRNVRRPSLVPGNILTIVNQVSDSKFNESTVVDSGYASELSTPNSQNRTSEASEASFKGETLSSPANILQRKITRLREFDKTVPAAAHDRFEDLKELFGTPLYQYVTKSGATFSAISMKLKVLGENEDTAKSWIVILCDKRIAKRVKRFFSQSWVKSECQLCHTDPDRPSFEILVYDRPPTPMAITSSASVYADAPKWPTLCGSIISVNTESHTRLATLGGVLSVTVAGGNTELYGMTVSHVIAGDQLEKDAYRPAASSREVDVGFEEEDSDDASEVDVFCEEQEYTLDLDFGEDIVSGAISIAKQNPSSGDSTPCPFNIGYVAITSRDALEDGSNLDWALLKIDDPLLYCSNLLFIPPDSVQGHVLSEPKDLSYSKSKTALSVFLLSGTRGVIRGMLSFTLSSLMLAPGKRFTDTYTLRLSNGLGLNAGDCGSWVVDSHSHEVYGHVVASDAFGEAYVIPMKNTFRCIEKQLSAQRVCLPRQHEEQERIGQRVDEPASEAKVDSPMDLLGSTIEGKQSDETCSDQNLFLMRSHAALPWTEHMVEASPIAQEAGGAGGLKQEISFPMSDEQVSNAQVESLIHLPGPTPEGKQSGETCSDPDINIFNEASLGLPMSPDAVTLFEQSVQETFSAWQRVPQEICFPTSSSVPNHPWNQRPDAVAMFEQPVGETLPAWPIVPSVRGSEPQENLFPTSTSAVPNYFWNGPFVDSAYNSGSVTKRPSPEMHEPSLKMHGPSLEIKRGHGAPGRTNLPFSTFGPDGQPSTKQLKRKQNEGDRDGLKNFLWRELFAESDTKSKAQVESLIHLPRPTTEGKQSGEICSGPDKKLSTVATLEKSVVETLPAMRIRPGVRGSKSLKNLSPTSSSVPNHPWNQRPDAVAMFEQPVGETLPAWQIVPSVRGSEPQENLFPTSSSAVPDHFWNQPFVDSAYNSGPVTARTSPQSVPQGVMFNCGFDATGRTNSLSSTFCPDGQPSTKQLERKQDEGDSDGLEKYFWADMFAEPETKSEASVESLTHLPRPTTELKQSGETLSDLMNLIDEASLRLPMSPDAVAMFEQPVEETLPARQIVPGVRGSEPQENLFPASSSAVPDHFWNQRFVDSAYNSRSVTARTSPQSAMINCDFGATGRTNSSSRRSRWSALRRTIGKKIGRG